MLGNSKDIIRKYSRRSLRSFFSLLVAGIAVFATDYALFVEKVGVSGAPKSILNEHREADAVVVLTGGANRIATGVDLLKANHGRRLLISGVSVETSRSDIGRLLNEGITIHGCCIDLDRKSLDTRGNAQHTAEWVSLHGFQKILVVTSNYHMPRSLMLLRERMPDIEVIGFPILPPKWDNHNLLHFALSPIVFREYAKYRIASFGFEPSIQRITSAFLSNHKKVQS